MEAQTITREETYNAVVEKVWLALTDREQMKQWYFDIPDFKHEVGCIFNFYEPGDERKYHHQCTITEIIPLEKFQHTWTHPGHSNGETLLTWELFRENNTTRVKLTHEGLENFTDAGPEFAKENYETGWKEIMGTSLKKFVETS